MWDALDNAPWIDAPRSDVEAWLSELRSQHDDHFVADLLRGQCTHFRKLHSKLGATLRNTPPFFTKRRQELQSMCQQLGDPHVFATSSHADTYCPYLARFIVAWAGVQPGTATRQDDNVESDMEEEEEEPPWSDDDIEEEEQEDDPFGDDQPLQGMCCTSCGSSNVDDEPGLDWQCFDCGYVGTH